MTTKIGFTNLSKHAVHRLNERTCLLEKELTLLLNSNSYFNLGSEIGFNRQHCLFYSAREDRYYVAVQDTKSGTVVTILLLEYHKTLSWKLSKTYLTIDDEVLRRAKLMAKYKLSQDGIPSKISLKIRYLNQDDKLKTALLKKYDAYEFGYNPLKLIQNNQRIINIVTQWKKESNVNEIIDIYSSTGRKSELYFAEDSVVDNLNN